MALLKTKLKNGEIAIFDEAVIYKRGEYWQYRMWLVKESKYVRQSLKTRSEATAYDKAKSLYHQLHANVAQGKTYFSLTTAEGMELYIANRQKDVVAGLITKGRLTTIRTHLAHWVKFTKDIIKNDKLKDLTHTDCENYFHSRSKTSKKIPASQTTVLNEQSTINAMMRYLHRHGETNIDSFDFKKLKRLDKNDDAIRRSTFTLDEACRMRAAVLEYIAESEKDLNDKANLTKYICCYYFLFAMLSGLRTGEQRQLKWSDISWDEQEHEGEKFSIVHIKVRAETSKVRESRKFEITDNGYLDDYSSKIWSKHKANVIGKSYIFSADGKSVVTKRAISYHFNKLLDIAEIEERYERDLVPYSFRHYFITHKVLSGLSYGEIADMCGNSAAHVEKTYYHTNKAMMRKNAMATYTVKNGMIVRT